MNKCMTAQCDGFKRLSLNLRGQAHGAINNWVGEQIAFYYHHCTFKFYEALWLYIRKDESARSKPFMQPV